METAQTQQNESQGCHHRCRASRLPSLIVRISCVGPESRDGARAANASSGEVPGGLAGGKYCHSRGEQRLRLTLPRRVLVDGSPPQAQLRRVACARLGEPAGAAYCGCCVRSQSRKQRERQLYGRGWGSAKGLENVKRKLLHPRQIRSVDRKTPNKRKNRGVDNLGLDICFVNRSNTCELAVWLHSADAALKIHPRTAGNTRGLQPRSYV
eukprot:scaffold6130_cov33-Prasinocladus_malaysianus.AAC.2